MNFKMASETNLTLLKMNAVLDAQLVRIQAGGEDSDFLAQRRLFGQAMSSLLDILNPIYREHPSLKPRQMGGEYEVPAATLDAAVKSIIG